MTIKRSTIELYGNIEENFYQLGLKDRESGKIVHADVQDMLRTPVTAVNKLIAEVSKNIIKQTLTKDRNKYPHLNAYAEGMQQRTEDLFYIMLIPEIISGMSKWAPGLIKGNLGCSSFFMRNQNQEMIHGRILDFPLKNSFDLYERTILYAFDQRAKIIGFSSAGIPYPSITATNEFGVTVALHQKFTNILNFDGESIFEIIFEMLSFVKNKAEALDFLKGKKSITTWCLYMSFSNGDVLAYDIMGDKAYYNEALIPEDSKNILYFCNHLEDPNLQQTEFIPIGFNDYNLMRETSAKSKIDDFIKKDNFTEIDLLKMMTSPPKKRKQYQMDCLTPTTLTATVLNPTAGNIHYLFGEAPKVYQNNIEKIENCFQNPLHKTLDDKKYKNSNAEYFKGLSALSLAQKGFDLKDAQIIYHQLQLAIDHLENYPDQIVAKFYFLIAQYLYEDHQKVKFHLLQEFKEIRSHLHGYLREQCELFIFRLEYQLNLPVTLEKDLLIHQKLRDIYELELKIPKAIFHFTTKMMMVPRVDILDVIYVYTH